MGIEVEDFEDYDEEEDSKAVVVSAKAKATASTSVVKPSARALPVLKKKPPIKDEDVIELLSDDNDDGESGSGNPTTPQNTAPVSSTSYFANFLKTALSAVNPSSSVAAPPAATAPAPSSTLLVYPATGRSRISVTHQDLASLDPGKELNDTIIDFYMRYIVEEIIDPARRSRVHVFST